jgi:hypothetical protein
MKVTTEASSTAKLRVSHCRGRPRGEYSEKLDREPGRVKPQPGQKKEKSIGSLPPGAFFLPCLKTAGTFKPAYNRALRFACLADVRACY